MIINTSDKAGEILERNTNLKLLSALLILTTLLTFFCASYIPCDSEDFSGIRYSREDAPIVGFPSLNPALCREVRFVRDTLCEAIVKNNDIYWKSIFSLVFTVLVCLVILMYFNITADIPKTRKYRLLI